MDGFYEWRKVEKVKQPYAIGRVDGERFTLSGSWENWKDARRRVGPHNDTRDHGRERARPKLHDRMPVVVAPAGRVRWLTDENPADLLKPTRPS